MNFDWNLILKRCVGALVWGFALVLAAWDVAVGTGIAGAFFGGSLGFLTGPLLARTRLRLSTLWAGGLVAALVILGLCRLPSTSATLASILGPEFAWAVYDGLTWLVGTFLLVAVLHASTLRHPAFMIAEIGLVGVALVTPLSAHRDGYISRPHFFVDPLWSRGWDPVPFLVVVGALTAATLLVLAVGRFNRRNTLPDLALLLVVAALLALFLPIARLQQLAPPPQEPLGLQGEGREKDQKPPPPMDEDGKDGDKEKEHKRKEEPKPEDQGESNKQPSPVAVVVFHDDFTPPDGFYYFRQKAFSMFNGARLVADTTGLADADLAEHFPGPEASRNEDSSGVGMDPEPMDEGLGREVETMVALIVPHTLPFGLLNPIRMQAQGNPDSDQFVRAYRVVSRAYAGDLPSLMGRELGSADWTPEQWEHYTRMPDDPRYKALAEKIISRLHEKYRSDPLARAVMLKLWLETEGTYSLRVRVLDSDDAVAKFLFGDRTGYCVHFAHSAAYLCRSLGIPARVATGYAADARYRFGGSTLVLMDVNSHAWCEIYLRGVGWIPLDVAPQQSDTQPAPPPDADLQRMLGELARKQAPSLEGEAQPKRSLSEFLQRAALLAARALGILAVLGLIGLYAWKAGRRLSPWLGPDAGRVQRTFRASLDRMADAGIYRPFGQTREEFARERAEILPTLASFTDLHLRTSMASPDRRPSPPRAEVLGLHRDLGREIARQAPLWRRMLGALNPFNWLFVK